MEFRIRLIESETGRTVAGALEVADHFFSRLRGLLGRREMEENTALILIPCGPVHTLGMRFAIDLIMLSREGRILAVKENVKPGRLAVPAPAGTHAVVEMAAGSVAGLTAGNRLEIRTEGKAPRSLGFLRAHGAGG